MDELEEQILQLVKEACCHPRGSKERNKKLNEIIWLLQQSGRLLRSAGIPDAEDALQQTWLYFCRNLCETTTAKHPFDPEKNSIITWVNVYLRYRLKDCRIKAIEKEYWTAKPIVDINGQLVDPVDFIPARPEPPPILEEIRQWLEQEGTLLRSIHVRDRPDIHCQILIERRLPPETSWEVLSKEFGVAIATLSSFYQRECFPRLLNFGKSQGYL
ncbi:sigma-70 family RNA polymerase sigma factor [Brasilonema sp. UFV-L1]|uniref:sigma-70 family RNA polymerase sigma factor n=1 Tax=Brasilonema sp. UFV-L1 TaxID=2234130 RepID=UPI00145E67D3|nr:sigma-70 family RNA polymerase sigma factor [Brasilonema sp. UFV-L1]NMG06212.1 sigma-70 family RNA polymerase sigma factor [Brasilonema sp. UFV-L1]